jgi:hypothetical protein
MTTFSHSGTTGDTLCALVIPKIFGEGEFYLKLNNLEHVINTKLGWSNKGNRHEGRMTEQDFEVMRELVLHQKYITKFEIWKGQEIDHELEDAYDHLETGFFPRNFSNQYALAARLDPKLHEKELQMVPWLECREPRRIPGRPVVIHRSPNYQEGNPVNSPYWRNLIDRGLEDQAVFVGGESDHDYFENLYKVRVPYYRTPDWMELARVIQGSELMVTSMGGPSALCLCLGKTMMLEPRKNEPHERLEINYPLRLNIQYF